MINDVVTHVIHKGILYNLRDFNEIVKLQQLLDSYESHS